MIALIIMIIYAYVKGGGFMKFLDNNGLSYFWQKLKSYINNLDATNVKSVNMIAPASGEEKNVVIEAKDVPFDDSLTPLESTNVQDAIDRLDMDMRYNAICIFDATIQTAPPNLPRGYNWHVEMVGDMLDDHQYRRYFYLDVEDAILDLPSSPNLSKAVACWVIDGKQMYFEYLTAGLVSTVVELTDENGAVLIQRFRPIPIGDTWFFGSNQANDFPTDDNVRSILDINVCGISTMLGNTFDLKTTNKQIVNAINEINDKVGTVKVHEEQTAPDALIYSQNNPDVFVFVARN